MQQQTGSRMKTAPVPGTPIVPLSQIDDQKKADKRKAIEPSKRRAVRSHSE